jgi:hypothetical protein
MTSLTRNARIAGLLYLTLLTAPLRLIYIPSKLFVAGNAFQEFRMKNLGCMVGHGDTLAGSAL